MENYCDIYINDTKTTFDYYYNFPKEGIYTIKYKFKELLQSTNSMFSFCKSITSIDLSNFKSQKVTDMSYMFFCCLSLKSLNLTNLNTENVVSFESMFCKCDNLISIDLSKFNTKSLINMENMFCYSKHLETINLSNFNTEKVNINLSIFIIKSADYIS